MWRMSIFHCGVSCADEWIEALIWVKSHRQMSCMHNGKHTSEWVAYVLWILLFNYFPWPFYLLSLRFFIICNSPTFCLTICDYQIHALEIFSLLLFRQPLI